MFAAAVTLVTLLCLPQGDDPLAPARAAVAAAEQAHGADSLEVAEQLLKLYGVLQQRGEGREALAVAKRAVVIREAKLPPDHMRLGIALSNLASAHLVLDEVEGVAALAQRARDIFAKGPPGRAMLGALTSLGAVELKLGNFEAARGWFAEALDHARQHAPDHRYLGMMFQNMAQIHLSTGDVVGAMAHIEEAIGVYDKVDPNGAGAAHAVYSMGALLLAADRLEAAEPMLRRGLELREQLHGSRHPGTGTCHLSLGWLLVRTERSQEGEHHLRQAGEVFAECGDVDAAVAAQYSLARMLMRRGDLEGAGALLTAATRLADDGRLLPVHRAGLDIVRCELMHRRGDHAEAVPILRTTVDVLLAHGYRGEKHATARRVLAKCLQRQGDDVGAAQCLLGNVLSFAELLDRTLPPLLQHERLDEVQQNRNDLDDLLELTAASPDAMPLADLHTAAVRWKGQVARAMRRQTEVARAGADGAACLRRLQQIASLEAMGRGDDALRRERERLETRLSRLAPTGPDRVVGSAQLGEALPADEALIDVFRYEAGSGARFVAFVVRRDGLHRVELGPADDLLAAVDRYVVLASRAVRAGSERILRSAAEAVRDRLLAPLLPRLAGCARLWISPDDRLAMLPFEVLPVGADETLLVERYATGYLQDASDLLTVRAKVADARLVAFGAIDYGGGGTVSAASRRGVPRPFSPLPKTEVELQAIERCFTDAPSVVLRGGAADEASLRRLAPTAGILHLATHGFCGEEGADEGVPAGVALAGANVEATADDGILTVDEAALLDLRACGLVVLSACQTGLGRPFAGESLLGLRRALRIAGAGATITSLWRVEDAATAELMGDFYRELRTGSGSAIDALRAARLRALARARAAAGEALPGLWGAFVLEGRG